MRCGKKIIKRLLWLKVNLGIKENTFVRIASLLIGFITGLASVLLKTTVYYTGNFINTIVNIESANLLYFGLPLLGIVLTVLYVKYFVKDSLAHGITKVLYAISRTKSKIAGHNNYSSIVGSTLTVGFGGSVGLEAPIVLTGASIGSNVAQLFNLDYRNKTLLLGCGVAAAIASIFKAPITGTLFVFEVLMIELSMTSIIPILLAAISGSLIASLLLGQAVVFSFAVFEPFNVYNIPFYVLLGLFTGFIGLYFTLILELVERFFTKYLQTYTKKILFGGVLLGLLIFLFPPLYGEGYSTLSQLFSSHPEYVLHNSWFWELKNNSLYIGIYLLLVIIFKAFATSFTTSAGGVGGVFAPALFLGGISGFLFGNIINSLNIATVSNRNLALVGMAGVLSAIMQAPLTSIFLIAEITGGFTLFPAIITTSIIAYLTIHFFEKYSIYTKRLAMEGDLLTHNKDQSILSLIDINELIETDFHIVNINGTLRDIVSEIISSHRNIFVVVDSDNYFCGLVLLDDVRNIMFDTGLYDEIAIKSIMKYPQTVIKQNAPVELIVHHFKQTNAWNLPVVDADNKYIGFLSKSKLFTTYRHLLVEISMR